MRDEGEISGRTEREQGAEREEGMRTGRARPGRQRRLISGRDWKSAPANCARLAGRPGRARPGALSRRGPAPGRAAGMTRLVVRQRLLPPSRSRSGQQPRAQQRGDSWPFLSGWPSPRRAPARARRHRRHRASRAPGRDAGHPSNRRWWRGALTASLNSVRTCSKPTSSQGIRNAPHSCQA